MASESIPLSLPRSAAAAGSSTFSDVLVEELHANEKRFESVVMRYAGGWLDGPLAIEVVATRAEPATVLADVRIGFRTQCVPGCGTDAIATDGSVNASIELDRQDRSARMRFLE